MVDGVAVLDRHEDVRLDTGRLMELVNELGAMEAENLVSRSMEELAVRLSFTERQYRQGKRTEMRKSAHALSAIAERVGLGLLARVSRDAVACAERDDETALAAVVARLVRIGEVSLAAIWEVQDRRI